MTQESREQIMDIRYMTLRKDLDVRFLTLADSPEVKLSVSHKGRVYDNDTEGEITKDGQNIVTICVCMDWILINTTRNYK
jgi:hypothetical protein